MSAVPVGVATKAGLGGALGQFVLAVVLLATGDHSASTQTLLGTAAATLVTVLIGRYAQASQAPADDEEVGDVDALADVPHHGGNVPADEGDKGGVR